MSKSDVPNMVDSGVFTFLVEAVSCTDIGPVPWVQILTSPTSVPCLRCVSPRGQFVCSLVLCGSLSIRYEHLLHVLYQRSTNVRVVSNYSLPNDRLASQTCVSLSSTSRKDWFMTFRKWRCLYEHLGISANGVVIEVRCSNVQQ
jgi:hypothetical protein